jgi:hypothetical protein
MFFQNIAELLPDYKASQDGTLHTVYTFTDTNRLILFMEMTVVYFKYHAEHKFIPWAKYGAFGCYIVWCM